MTRAMLELIREMREGQAPYYADQLETLIVLQENQRTDRERLLGLEVAKLSKRIYSQRLVIRELTGVAQTQVADINIRIEDVLRMNASLKDQNRKLVTENRELRLYIAGLKL